MSNVKPRILIVEDEEAIAEGLTDLFVFHGYEVTTIRDGRLGLQQATSGTFDAVILDVMLPHVDGFSILAAVREKDREQPVIMLTAKSLEEDVVHGLKLGADDYLTKPFSVRELLLRVEALLRRAGKLQREREKLKVGEVLIDPALLSGRHINGSSIEFSRREIEILYYLSRAQERYVPRSELLEEVWGYARAENMETRTVDIHIAKIRRKVEPDPKNPRILVTARGEGYRLNLSGKS